MKQVALTKKWLICLLFLMWPNFVYGQSLIPMGHTVQVKLQYEHVVVSEEIQMGKQKLNRGDLIVSVNGRAINSIKELPLIVKQRTNIQFQRGNQKGQIAIERNNWPVFYHSLKDQTDGIGTVTYLEQKNKQFGALGHAIEDKQMAEMPAILSGHIYLTKIKSIHKSKKGVPGYKVTKSETMPIGHVASNTIVGVFGTWESNTTDSLRKPIEIIQEEEIKVGNATILTQIKQDEVTAFDIKITDVSNSGILFEVTDQQLIDKTGGIVQGMSGSPIIQNDKFVGAITHMFVENPKKGAAIWVGHMIKKS